MAKATRLELWSERYEYMARLYDVYSEATDFGRWLATLQRPVIPEAPKASFSNSLDSTGAMVGTAAGYVAAAAREDEQAAAAGAPLVLWVSFATLLAEEIWRRNDQG